MTRLSRYKLKPSVLQQLIDQFFAAAWTQASPKEFREFFANILTPVEIETFAKRLAILKRLANKDPYWLIEDEVKVTGATITKMSNLLKRSGRDFGDMLKELAEKEAEAKRKQRRSKYVKGSKRFYPRRID